MDPKNVDRIGKVILSVAGAALAAAAKKYGPKVIEVASKAFKIVMKK